MPNIDPKYIEALDGHPVYKWSQERMLRAAFNKLDAKGEGNLYRENLSNLSEEVGIQSLIRLTLFWKYVKNQNWGFFYSIFDDNVDTITVDDWLSKLKSICHCKNVQPQHVRTHAEHRQINISSSGLWDECLQKENKNSFAKSARENLNISKLERSAWLRRNIQDGDFVWGLYNGGYTWLPSIVETIDDVKGTYNLKYILTMEEYNESLNATLARSYMLDHKDEATHVKQLQNQMSESDILKYIFTKILTLGNQNFLSTIYILQRLKDHTMVAVISCSAYLKHLLRSRNADKLQKVFLSMKNEINCTEFVEFCCFAFEYQ
jgi:hypothetical protein